MQLSLQVQIQEAAALHDVRGAPEPRGVGTVEDANGAGPARGLRTDGDGGFHGSVEADQAGSPSTPDCRPSPGTVLVGL